MKVTECFPTNIKAVVMWALGVKLISKGLVPHPSFAVAVD